MPPFLRRLFGALLLCNLPVQVWATPDLWGEAVNILIMAANLFPEPLDTNQAGSVDAGGYPAGSMDVQLAGSMTDQAMQHFMQRTLADSIDIPAPPLHESIPPDATEGFVQCTCYVMAPQHQAETLSLAMHTPFRMETLLREAKEALRSLHLRFADRVIPTFPQLGVDFASLLVVPAWITAGSMQVVVFDFRALDGPVYASLLGKRFRTVIVPAKRDGTGSRLGRLIRVDNTRLCSPSRSFFPCLVG